MYYNAFAVLLTIAGVFLHQCWA